MSEPEPSRPTERAPVAERLTLAAHRYFLPIVGGAAVAGGALWLSGIRVPVSPLDGAAVLAAGAGVLVTVGGFHHWHRSPTAAPAPSHPEAGAETVPPSGAAALHSARSVWAAHAVGRPHSGLGRSVVSVPVRPGDELWGHWNPSEPARLGASIVGPVPETAYVPPRDGATRPFARRDRDLLVVPVAPGRGPRAVRTPSRPRPAPGEPSSRREPFSDDELDELFPPDLDRLPSLPREEAAAIPDPIERPRPVAEISVPTDRAPTTLAAPVPAAILLPAHAPPAGTASPRVESVATGAGVTGPRATAEGPDLVWEAMNPTPPHLRPGAPRTQRSVRGPGTRRRVRHLPPWFCADCCRSVTDLRTWAPCPECRRPMCRRCIGASLMSGAEGRCPECSGPRDRPGADRFVPSDSWPASRHS